MPWEENSSAFLRCKQSPIKSLPLGPGETHSPLPGDRRLVFNEADRHNVLKLPDGRIRGAHVPHTQTQTHAHTTRTSRHTHTHMTLTSRHTHTDTRTHDSNIQAFQVDSWARSKACCSVALPPLSTFEVAAGASRALPQGGLCLESDSGADRLKLLRRE